MKALEDFFFVNVLKATAQLFFAEAHSIVKSIHSFGYTGAFRIHVLRRPLGDHLAITMPLNPPCRD